MINHDCESKLAKNLHNHVLEVTHLINAENLPPEEKIELMVKHVYTLATTFSVLTTDSDRFMRVIERVFANENIKDNRRTIIADFKNTIADFKEAMKKNSQKAE